MNPRRVHELMLSNFPSFSWVDADWIVAVDEDGVRMSVMEALLTENIEGDEILIEVHRKRGDCLNRAEALNYIRENCRGGARIAARDFTGFVVIASNGVATGWKNGASGQTS